MPKLNVEIKGFKEILLISLYPFKDFIIMFIRFLFFVYDIIKISYSYYQDFIIIFIDIIKIL